MAEPTKAEIQKERDEFESKLIEREAELEEARKVIALSPHANDANYEAEIQRLTKKLSIVESEYKAHREKTNQEQRERETIAEDKRREEERILAQFGIRKIDQSEHTRFRISPRPPKGQRDIFGDPESEVVNLGVELDQYSGGLYVPVSVIVEIGQSIGMLTAEQAESLKSELAVTTAKVESAGTFAKELLSGISANVDHFYSQLDSVVSADAESDEAESGTPGIDSSESEGEGDSEGHDPFYDSFLKSNS